MRWLFRHKKLIAAVLFVIGMIAVAMWPRTLEVDVVAPLPPATWRAIEAEAQRLAVVRGVSDVAVARGE